MKFRCRITDVVNLRDFTNIINVVSRIAKKCVLRFTPNEFCFNIGDENIPVVWVELSQSHFFVEYTINGVSDEQNEIYLECESSMLARSIGSLRMTGRGVKIKLTNKRQPCLTFEIELASLTMESRQCVHDIPVRVIPRKEWPEYRIPIIPEFDISIEMPQLKHVRNIVERMKNMMSTRLILMADKTGMLMLKIETESANVSTHFQGLHVLEDSTNSKENISAVIDIRKFLMFLTWDVVHPDIVKCNIIQDKMVHLFLDLAGYLKVQYFIPAIVI